MVQRRVRFSCFTKSSSILLLKPSSKPSLLVCTVLASLLSNPVGITVLAAKSGECTTASQHSAQGDPKKTSQATILVKIYGTSQKIELPPFQSCLNQTPFDHLNIELGGKGNKKDLNVCFRLDILGNITKTRRFAYAATYLARIVDHNLLSNVLHHSLVERLSYHCRCCMAISKNDYLPKSQIQRKFRNLNSSFRVQ